MRVALALMLLGGLAFGPLYADGPAPTPAPPTPARIAKLIDALDALAYRERAAATRALIQIGDPAVPALAKALAGTPSPERAARVRRILDTLKMRTLWRSFKGGVPVLGLQITLRTRRTQFRVGDRIALHFELSNIGKTPRPISRRKTCDLQLPNGHRSSGGSVLKLVVRQTKGTRVSGGWGMRGGRAPGVGKLEPLAPGGRLRHELSLFGLSSGMGRLGPGTYEVHAIYFAKTRGLLPEAPGDIESNRITIRIR